MAQLDSPKFERRRPAAVKTKELQTLWKENYSMGSQGYLGPPGTPGSPKSPSWNSAPAGNLRILRSSSLPTIITNMPKQPASPTSPKNPMRPMSPMNPMNPASPTYPVHTRGKNSNTDHKLQPRSTANILLNADPLVQKRRRSGGAGALLPNLTNFLEQEQKVLKTNAEGANGTALHGGSFVQQQDVIQDNFASVAKLARKLDEQPLRAMMSPVEPRSPATPSLQGRRRTTQGSHPPHASEIFALLDTNGNRLIDAPEWIVFDEMARRLWPELVLQGVLPSNRNGCGAEIGFDAADIDGNGVVDTQEWMEYVAAIVGTMGLQWWEQAAKKMVQAFHTKEKAGNNEDKGVHPSIRSISHKVKSAKIENHLLTADEAKHLSKALQGGIPENCVVTLTFKETLFADPDTCRELAEGIVKATGLRTVIIDSLKIPLYNLLFQGEESRGEFNDGEQKITVLDWTKMGFEKSNGNDITCFILSELLKDKRCCLVDLYLHPKQLSVEAAHALGEALRINRTVTHVRLGGPIFHQEIRNNQIKEIDWTSKRISSRDVIVLAHLLKDNSSVRTLKFADNAIDASGATALCELLKTSTSIIALDLSTNPDLGDDAAMIMSEMLMVNKTLQVLMLKGSGICNNGATALATALPTSGLKKLFLQYNKIDGLGCAALAGALQSSPQLEELNLTSNQIPEQVKASYKPLKNRMVL